jgi:hypothetical protein
MGQVSMNYIPPQHMILLLLKIDYLILILLKQQQVQDGQYLNIHQELVIIFQIILLFLDIMVIG